MEKVRAHTLGQLYDAIILRKSTQALALYVVEKFLVGRKKLLEYVLMQLLLIFFFFKILYLLEQLHLTNGAFVDLVPLGA